MAKKKAIFPPLKKGVKGILIKQLNIEMLL
jgi:hypothetical protein